MKILIINYRYFVSGGPERYMFNVSSALEKWNHEVIFFSINYAKNQPSEFSNFFVKSIGTPEQVYFREHTFHPSAIYNSLKRLLYDPEVEKRIMDLVEYSKPDVAYILKYLRKLSPAVLVGLKKKNIPIVVRLSDYEMACPNGIFLRDDKPCEECAKKNLWMSVKYKCVQDSYVASILNLLATNYHRKQKYFDVIDTFVVTNNFMLEKMLEAKIPKEKIKVIPTFTDSVGINSATIPENPPSLAYVGRLERIKGVHTILEALHFLKKEGQNNLPAIYIVGEGNPKYEKLLLDLTARFNLQTHVKFLGYLEKENINKLIQKSWATILPSLWYENLPNSLLESYANGVPVIASNIGSIPEFIRNEQTGFLFEAGDASDLAKKITQIQNPTTNYHMRAMVVNYSKKFTEGSHINNLENVFLNVIKNRQEKMI